MPQVPPPPAPDREGDQPGDPPAAVRSSRIGALRHRNYRLFFGGQVVSMVGTWMQSVALPWLSLQLTHDAFFVGLVLAVQFTPTLLFAPFAGMLADRYPKRRILLVTNILFVLPASVLFLLTANHLAQYWMVLVAAAAQGTINLVDVPARQAFVIEMVGRQDLINAIALNSTIFNGAAVIGPSIAGLLIAYVGLPLCFLGNALSYVAALVALLLMSGLPDRAMPRGDEPLLKRLRAGLDYARRDRVVGTLLLTVAVFSLFSMNRMTLFPIFAAEVLHVGARGFGFLTAAQGLGAVVGAVALAGLGARLANGRMQFAIGLAWSFFLVLFALSRDFNLSILFLVLGGFCQIIFVSTCNSRIQSVTPDELRGRVMSLYAQSLMGVGPLGSLQAGGMASWFGAPIALLSGAVVSALFLGGSRLLRPEVFSDGPPVEGKRAPATTGAGSP